MNAFSIWLYSEQYSIGHAITLGEDVRLRADASDSAIGAVAVAELAALVVTAICWVAWQRRCHANLHAFGERDLKYSTSQATWAWFIPFVNLVRPYDVLKEVSYRTTHRDESKLLLAWWLLWLGSGFFLRSLANIKVTNGDTLMTSSLLSMAGCVLLLLRDGAAMRVVWNVSESQRMRASGSLALPDLPTRPQLTGAPASWRAKKPGTPVGCPACGCTVRIGDATCQYCRAALPSHAVNEQVTL